MPRFRALDIQPAVSSAEEVIGEPTQVVLDCHDAVIVHQDASIVHPRKEAAATAAAAAAEDKPHMSSHSGESAAEQQEPMGVHAQVVDEKVRTTQDQDLRRQSIRNRRRIMNNYSDSELVAWIEKLQRHALIQSC